MKLERVANLAEGSRLAAGLFRELAESNPASPVGLATGSTMQGVYAELAGQGYRPSCPDAFALDEYLGIDPDHKNSYQRELTAAFCEQLGWSGRLHVPGRGDYESSAGYQLFETRIQELGPISVQLLGLGANGHIAFNEPGSNFDSRTREVDLAEQTIADNSRFFEYPAETPTRAVTQGIATIMQAKNILLLVFGVKKLAAARAMLSGKDPQTPASALTDHPSVTVITDLDL